MKTTILLVLIILAIGTSCSQKAYQQTKQERQMNPKKVNERNKKNLKKWGLGTIENWEEVQHA